VSTPDRETSVEVVERTGDRRACRLVFGDAPPWRVALHGFAPDPLVATAGDLFESLAELRAALERSGARLLCQGACRDVLPSPAARQSGGGRMAYRLRMGEPTRRDDLVDIFAPADPACLGSVAEQRAYARAWLASLG
jgi:hypothetical protein